MRSQKARLNDWLFKQEDASGTLAAAQEPFDSFGPMNELRRVVQQSRAPVQQGSHDCARIRVLRVLLACPGVSAIEVEDGQSAVDLLSLRSFDMILLGMNLPVMTGPDVVRWVRRSQTPWCDIPILGMIGDEDRDIVGRLMSWGMTDWTPKPIARQHLGEKLVGLMPNLAGAGL
jgi:CheY-like chemotaxis protein